MKVGIIVPYSWSFWGGVNEHAELQSEALRRLGFDTRTLIGNDPPGNFTRVLHPRHGRHDDPPPDVLPVGRSVIVPANSSLPNIVLSPRAIFRVQRILERERFDVIHCHEPMTPVTCVAALAHHDGPSVATFHASGELGWLRLAMPMWGFLMDRLDRRIAVSEGARESAAAYLPGEYQIIPNGVLIPVAAQAANRSDTIVFIGRHDKRKGLSVLLKAWPEIYRRTGHRLRVVGADPLSVRLLIARGRVSDEGIDILGYLSQTDLTEELLSTKALVAPSLGGESFGIVLARGFACATPVVASDIGGYRDVMTPETGVLVPPDDPPALTEAIVKLVEDEPRRRELGASARRLAEERYSWAAIAARLAQVYTENLDVKSLVRNPFFRGSLVIPLAAGVTVLFWWRGPDWNAVGDAFKAVSWQWVAVAIALNLLSVVARSLAWMQVIDAAVEREYWPRFRHIFSAFCVGLLGNAILPARVGEVARVGVLLPKMPKRRGLWAILVGTVFAHRVFDLVPVMLLILYVAVAADVPQSAAWGLIGFVILGVCLLVLAFLSAKHHHRSRLEELGAFRQIVAMLRHGLGVMRSGPRALAAVVFQTLGWTFQLLAVYTAMLAFNIHAPLPAAGLVLVLMNVATIFPIWPGNVGIVQAAIAYPLANNYGVPYAHGVAFGFGLQAIEASVGVGIGLIFLMREGLSFANLRRMPTASEVDAIELPTAEEEAERARAGVSG